MASTYTEKLGLAKPANGDVDWHIPVNENWDKIDTELDKALKISGTTIDADKDWNNKAITNLGSLTSHGKTILNSSGEFAGGGVAEILYPDPDRAAANICAQNLTENNTMDDAWTQLLVLPAVPANLAVGPTHTVQVAWEHCESYAGSWGVASRVYVNGVAVGPIRGTSSTGYSVVSDPIDVSPGDVISIWGHGNAYDGVRVYVRNVKAYAVAVLCARPAAW